MKREVAKWHRGRVAKWLAIASLPPLGVCSSVAMLTGDATNWGAGFVAGLAGFAMLFLVVPAAVLACKAPAPVRFDVPVLAVVEAASALILLYGIKYEWWVS